MSCDIPESDYGTCPSCSAELEPVWFVEEETKIVGGVLTKTGRKRKACDCLVCPACLHEETVDDTFDGPWR